MVPILINKGVFEPNYNDLKFRVWNHYYFCTNLIFDGKLQKPNKGVIKPIEELLDFITGKQRCSYFYVSLDPRSQTT